MPTRQTPGVIAPDAGAVAPPATILSADDQHLFNEGTHERLYLKLGAHLHPGGGAVFRVWAPNARYVSVVGDFNGWNRGAHPMHAIGASGIWERELPEAREGQIYKYHIASHHGGYSVDKADPFGFRHECPPRTGSVLARLDYEWKDGSWMSSRAERQRLDRPMSVYEVHLGSWMRVPEDHNRSLHYRELAPRLAEYVKRLGFTHVEFLPVMEHPLFASWGYQTTGYFAPSSRFGSPQDFMFLIDTLHQHGIGVILDWVPSHFPTDEHGLAYFDGTHLFEHADARQGFHPDWKSAIFNYGRHEVRSFLLSSAMFWLDRYHADALRVDAVASMLYLDYARQGGEWIPNRHGGKENLEAIEFLRRLNASAFGNYPGVQMIAEESTAWPMVSRPTYTGGLGFGMKWDMGWMHDTLKYFARDPVHRRHHHNDITFRAVYQYSENYMLPLSHDEVVHMKKSLLDRMPGDEWQRFANLRLLLANQWTNPGKKLLFMGGEFGQWREWNHDSSLDWHLTHHPMHKGVQTLVKDLNELYTLTPALHEGDCDQRGFEWVIGDDSENSVLAFLRRRPDPSAQTVGVEWALVVMNCTPVPRDHYRVGVPVAGAWKEALNTDAQIYGGSGKGNLGLTQATETPSHGRPASLVLHLPPLAALVLLPETRSPDQNAKPSVRK